MLVCTRAAAKRAAEQRAANYRSLSRRALSANLSAREHDHHLVSSFALLLVRIHLKKPPPPPPPSSSSSSSRSSSRQLESSRVEHEISLSLIRPDELATNARCALLNLGKLSLSSRTQPDNERPAPARTMFTQTSAAANQRSSSRAPFARRGEIIYEPIGRR